MKIVGIIIRISALIARLEVALMRIIHPDCNDALNLKVKRCGVWEDRVSSNSRFLKAGDILPWKECAVLILIWVVACPLYTLKTKIDYSFESQWIRKIDDCTL